MYSKYKFSKYMCNIERNNVLGGTLLIVSGAFFFSPCINLDLLLALLRH